MTTSVLQGLRLLVVEDEALIAMMITDQLTDLGCEIVGVAASVAKGLALIEDKATILDGALLDVNLGGEKVYPLAQELDARGIPFALSTGYGAAGIDANYSTAPILSKPYNQRALELVLMQLATRSNRPPAGL